MELRVLNYFITIAQEGNMTKAAAKLHVSQSALSTQIRHLEEELNTILFERHSHSLELTRSGMYLLDKAKEITALVSTTEKTFLDLSSNITGDIYIGCAETIHIRFLIKAIASMQEKYPDIKCHLIDADLSQLSNQLDNGSLDFLIHIGSPDSRKYNIMRFPASHIWGVVMRKDSPLASKSIITIEDLYGYPVFANEQVVRDDLPLWVGDKIDNLYTPITFNLVFNARYFVEAGLGYLITIDNLVDLGSDLCFRPLKGFGPAMISVIWKKHKSFSPAAEELLREMQDVLNVTNKWV